MVKKTIKASAQKSFDASKILYIFFILAIIFSIINASLVLSKAEKIKQARQLAELENQPAKLSLIKIYSSACKDCFNIDSVIENLKKSPVNITSQEELELSSPKAKQLIKEYNIQKLPTLIVLGEANKSNVANLWNQDWRADKKGEVLSSAVFVGQIPPYADSSGNIKGLVSITHIIDSTCPLCTNLTQIIDYFKQNKVRFASEKELDYKTEEAQQLISKQNIQRIPALVVSENILEYPSIKEVWSQLNTTQREGFYALHATLPPYRDFSSEKLVGLLKVIYLKDESCTSCYNILTNKQILEQNFGAVIENETFLDISSEQAKKLIEKYNIIKVPTILISSDADAYSSLQNVWSTIGTIEKDGWYVMRSPDRIGTYEDLTTGDVINTITVYGAEFEFQPNQITVNKGETVKLTFINAGTVEHDLVIDELNVKTKLLQPRTSETVEFIASKTGTFSFYCSVEGHKEQGMIGKITIE